MDGAWRACGVPFRGSFARGHNASTCAPVALACRPVQAEANALETPLLERNLIALSTIASIATMVGLLGTTIGMIRSFKAMGHAGAPDAIQLAIGISEALINTAGGLFIAIIGIIAYNYFTNRVDSFNYQMDETAYEVMQLLQHQKGTQNG